MKIKSFFLTFMAVIAFSACNNEIVSPTPNIEEKVEGYLMLNLADPVKTRTSVPGGGSVDYGTTEENTISGLTVVLTNEAGDIFSVIKSGITDKKSDLIKTEVGEYYVYALVNSDVDVKVGENIERVIAVAAAADATSGFKNGKFLMVNQRNSSGNAGVMATVSESNTIDEPLEVKISVDRAACKIVYEENDPNIEKLVISTGGIIDEVEVVGLTLLNVNTKFNLIQSWSKDNTDGLLLDAEVLSTPLHPDRETGKIADQYFHNIGDYTELTKTGNDITGITDLTIGKENDIFGKTPVYTTENRPTIFSMEDGALNAGRGETTGVIYKVQAKKDNENVSTFYKYKKVIYTDIANIQALTDFDEETLGDLEAPELRALGINVYENGVIYYTYFIRDPNVAHQYNGKNYYGVFRNSSYKLAVNSISSLGDDVPGGAIVDPETPGEPGNPPINTEETYLQVVLEVNKWVVSNIVIDF